MTNSCPRLTVAAWPDLYFHEDVRDKEALERLRLPLPIGELFAQGLRVRARYIRIGFAIAPVPLNLAGRNPALVGLARRRCGSRCSPTERSQGFGCNHDSCRSGPQTSITPQTGTPTLASRRKPTRPLTSLEARTSAQWGLQPGLTATQVQT